MAASVTRVTHDDASLNIISTHQSRRMINEIFRTRYSLARLNAALKGPGRARRIAIVIYDVEIMRPVSPTTKNARLTMFT